MTHSLYDFAKDTIYPINTRWLFFYVDSTMYVAAHGPECGWSFDIVGPLVSSYFDRRARDPETKDMTLIFLEGRPTREELDTVVSSGARLNTAGADDRVETDFLKKYAPLALRPL